MKNALLSLLCCCSAHLLTGQIGFSGSFVKINAPEWETLFEASDRYAFGPDFQFKPAYQLGIDYWFRLKNYRVEFFPTLSYAQFKEDQELLNSPAPGLISRFKWSFFNFSVNTNIYPFDFEGDCHCPTWSKQNPFFKKGFFFQVSPGVLFSQHNITGVEGDPNQFDSNDVAFNLGVGLGLDIGISDFLTVTPFARVKRTFNVQWEGLSDIVHSNGSAGEPGNRSNVNQLEAGIRLGIRWSK